MGMHNIRLLMFDDTLQGKRYFGVGHGRMMASFLFVKPTGALRCTFDAIDLQAVMDLVFRDPRYLQCSHRHLVTALHKLDTQILNMTFLTADDRRVELREHQDMHAVLLAT